MDDVGGFDRSWGAGEGETAMSLAERGFVVDAVERDPVAYERLIESCPGASVIPHLVDLMGFPLPPRRYALIVVRAVLHFLRPTELWPLADRLVEALMPASLFVAEVFTIDDPGFSALKESGAAEIEPNTFEAPEPVGRIHYFEPGVLGRIFPQLEALEYDESRRADPRSEEGFRAGAALVGKKAVAWEERSVRRSGCITLACYNALRLTEPKTR